VILFVLDSSMTMAWCYEDESTDETVAALNALNESEAVTPSIWPLEVANTLLVGERRKRSTPAHVAAFLDKLDALPVRVESEDPHRTLRFILPLARETGLSSYDTAYLELAIRMNLPLASLDGPLRKTARARGVRLIPAD
jgi:predicted nucleic acid-binding protein